MQEEISGFADGELGESQADGVCRRLQDGQGRDAWQAYHLIGDCLRYPDLNNIPASMISGDFLQRMAKELALEPTVLAPPPKRMKPAFIAWAAAATVAAAGFVGWFALQEYSAPTPPMVAAAVPAKLETQAKRDVNLNDYVAVHQQYATLRPYIRNAASEQDPTQ